MDPALGPRDDKDRRDENPDEICEVDTESYRKECDRVLDEDSDSGDPEPEKEDSIMDTTRTDQEVDTESPGFGELVDTDSGQNRMTIPLIGVNWCGEKEK